jgi:hypothetical protein
MAQEIRPVVGLQNRTAIEDREGNLPFVWNPTGDKFAFERLLVNRFQKTVAEDAVDGHCRTDDCVCIRIATWYHERLFVM